MQVWSGEHVMETESRCHQGVMLVLVTSAHHLVGLVQATISILHSSGLLATLLTKSVRKNGGRNWDVQHIALIDLNRCDIYADVSSAQLARTHGLKTRRELGLAISNREVILRAVPPCAVLVVRSVREVIRNPCDEFKIDHRSEIAYERWRHYAQWVERSRYPGVLRPNWLTG